MKKGHFADHCIPFRPTSFGELKLKEARIVRNRHGEPASRSIQIVLNFLPQQLRNESISPHFCKRMFCVRFERTPSSFRVGHINVVESTATVFIKESEQYAKRFSMNEVVLIESARDHNCSLRVEVYAYEEPGPPPPPDPADVPPF